MKNRQNTASIMITVRLFVSLILVCTLVQLASAKKTEILDQDGSSIETVAQAVCDITRGTDRQISQFSTIGKLVQFFHSLEPDHHLAACAQQSLPALEQMQLILNTDNGNVCSEAKIKLIEKFHRNFISKIRKYKKEQKASNLSAPKLIKLFYLHYASAVSAACERAATQDLQTIRIDRSSASEEADQKLNQVAALFGKIDPARGYKDMFVLWNFVDTLPLEKDGKLSRYLHQGSTRLVLQMHSVEPLTKMQDGCREIKQFYSHSLFPVIRLADLGFYPESEQLAQMLSSDPTYSYFYSATQLCETFLPLKAFQNESLNEGQIVILSKEDKATLDLGEDSQDQSTSSATEVESGILKNVEDDDSQSFIKNVKANVNSRVSEHNKILRRMIRKFKGELKHQGGQFILADGSTKEDLGSIVQESLPAIESNPLGSVEDDREEDEDVLAVRKKRGVMKFFAGAFRLVYLGLLKIVYFIAGIILVLLQSCILVPALLITYFLDKKLKIHSVHGFGTLITKGLEYKIRENYDRI